MQEYEIEFYDKPDGSEPAKEFILSLDKKMQAKVLRTVALLREEGPFLREPYSKALDDGIFEIRTKFGSDITRVLYFFVIGKRVILATVYNGNIIKNLIMDCQSYTKYRPNETTGGIFVSWRRKEELPTGA